jgi:lycopene cyclase domain-containing protein
MMTYWLINIWFLGAALLFVLASWAVGVRLRWVALGIAAGVLLLMTAVFDNMIIGFGVVDYDPDLISGIRIGLAPLEDFAYTVVAVSVVPLVWAWGERYSRPRRVT